MNKTLYLFFLLANIKKDSAIPNFFVFFPGMGGGGEGGGGNDR